MKIKFRSVFLIFLATLLVAACGSGRKNEKEIESLREQYSEAVAERDFDKARMIAEKAESKDDTGQHLKYVNENEIFYLLSSNSRDNANRILYMVKAFSPSVMPDTKQILEVAILGENEYLASKLIQSGVKVTDNTINTALNTKMTELLALIVKNDVSSLENSNLLEYADSDEQLKGYASNFRKEKAEKVKKDFEESLKRFFAEGNFIRPSLGVVKSDHYGDIPSEYERYNELAEDYNSKAFILISQALEMSDRAAAQKIVQSMKTTLEWKVLGDWVKVVEHEYDHSSVYDAYQVTESRNDINRARGLL